MFKQKAILQFEESKKDLFVRHHEDEMSLDTYFNSLNLFPIKRYTDGKKLTIKLEYKGDAIVRVYSETKENKAILFESANLVKTIEIDLNELDEKSIIYPVFRGNFELISLTYEVDATEKKISTAVIFTTFNRQEFLIPNLYKLNTCENVDKVVVVDNAKNVVLPNDLTKNKFIVVPNDNLGGSGGFTRGMVEAKKLGVTHIFIMDDDITLLPEVEDKALSLISCLREDCKENWLGFSMLSNDRPTFQYELGEKWEGIPLRKNANWLDLTLKESLFENQVVTHYNYSAWWSLIMPISVIDNYKLPFPFFIKFDDVEYALRRTHEEIILTNGFGVWHEDFDKKHAAWLNYYHFRNGIITNALHDKKPLWHSLVAFMGKCVKCYLRGRFIELKLLDIGMNDFFKGPDFFYNLDIVKRNNEIREIAKHKMNVFKGIFIMPFVQCFYFWKLLFKYNKTKRQFRKDVGKITSEEYWNKVFNHD